MLAKMANKSRHFAACGRSDVKLRCSFPRVRSVLCKRMEAMNNFPPKAKAGVIVLTVLSVSMVILSIYGLSLHEFVYQSRRTAYCFSGLNRILFFSSLLFLGLLFFSMCSFGYLYMFGIVEKRKPNSIANTLAIPLLVVPVIIIIITAVIAMSNCG